MSDPADPVAPLVRTRGISIGAVILAVLLLALSTLGGIEVFQRHRFDALESRVQSALEDFKAKALLTQDEQGSVRIASGPDPVMGSYGASVYNGANSFQPNTRGLYWQISPSPGLASLAPKMHLTLMQDRILILLSPRIRIILDEKPIPSALEVLKRTLSDRELTFSIEELD